MFDEEKLLRLAFSDASLAAPSEEEVAHVLRAVPMRRKRRVRRTLALAFAMFVLTAGVALAIPQTRDLLFESFGRVGDFLGGGELPAEGAGEASGELNYLDLAQSETPRTLVEFQGERLIAFRRKGTWEPCLGLGRHIVECGDAAHWRMRFPNPVAAVITTTPTTDPDRAAVWGIVASDVSRVQLRYRDGSVHEGSIGRNGFVVLGHGAGHPVALVAFGRTGKVLAELRVSGLQWSFDG